MSRVSSAVSSVAAVTPRSAERITVQRNMATAMPPSASAVRKPWRWSWSRA